MLQRDTPQRFPCPTIPLALSRVSGPRRAGRLGTTDSLPETIGEWSRAVRLAASTQGKAPATESQGFPERPHRQCVVRAMAHQGHARPSMMGKGKRKIEAGLACR
jgi:hypothetical protein